MDCENNVEIEMENTVRDQGLAELEISKLEEKLRSSRKECEELKHTITGWIDRDKRGKALYDEACEENSKRGKTISELNEKIHELEIRNEGLVGEYEEKLRCMDEAMKNLRVKLVESDKVSGVKNEEMFENKIIFELNEKINELKHKNSENERLVVAVCHEKFQHLDANEKLKSELTELKSQLSSSLSEKEELSVAIMPWLKIIRNWTTSSLKF